MKKLSKFCIAIITVIAFVSANDLFYFDEEPTLEEDYFLDYINTELSEYYNHDEEEEIEEQNETEEKIMNTKN